MPGSYMASALLSTGGNMEDVCVWRYEAAQFAGGPFYSTSCGQYLSVYNGGRTTCPNCGKPIEYEGEDE